MTSSRRVSTVCRVHVVKVSETEMTEHWAPGLDRQCEKCGESFLVFGHRHTEEGEAREKRVVA